MVLFKKYYKEANDSIKPNRELIDKIFEAAEKPAKKKSVVKFYKFGMAAAAVLVLVLSVSVLPNMFKNGESKGSEGTVPIAHSGNENPSSDGKTADQADVSVEIDEKINPEQDVEPNGEEPKQQIETISPEEPEDGTLDSSPDNPVLAIETGEGQGFSIPDGRIIDAPPGTAETKEYSISVDELEEATQQELEDINAFFQEKYGEKDEMTGFPLGFYTEGKADVDGETLYFVRMQWLVDNNHWSTVQTFVINQSMTELYYSVVMDGTTVYWSTSENQLSE